MVEISQGDWVGSNSPLCMRAIGAAEKALQLLCREVFLEPHLGNPWPVWVVILMS